MSTPHEHSKMKSYPFSRLIQTTLTAAFAIGFLTACSKTEDTQQSHVVRPVKLYTVTDGQTLNYREFPAIVSSNQEASLSFRIPGELIDFPVTSAAIVQKGQVLARLDDRDIKNEVAARQADFDLASSEYRRIKSLLAKNMVSQSDYDRANSTLKATRVNLQLAKDHLTDSILTAPFSGRVAQTLVENHQSVQAQQPVLVLQDHQTLEISIQLPESILTQVNEKNVDTTYQPVVTFAGSNGTEYKASYKEHATRVTPGTQSYEVIFTLPTPPDFTVYPGMGANLTLDLSRILGSKLSGSSVSVPVTAVMKDEATGDYKVWVYNPDNHTVEPRIVTLGRVTQSGISLTSGVEKGEQVVSAGLNRLRPGMVVKPLERERGV